MEEEAREKEEDEDQDQLAMPRNNILLRKLPVPKYVQLPNGRVFLARYQNVGRDVLNPTRVRIARTYVRKIGLRRQRQIGPRDQHGRKQQVGGGLDIAMIFDFGKKAAG